MSDARPYAFRHYLLFVLASGLAVATVGVALLGWECRQAMRDAAEMQEVRALGALDEIRESLREGGKTPDARRAAFLEMVGPDGLGGPSGARPLPQPFTASPSGTFIWEPKKGLVWQTGLAQSLQTQLVARTTWNAWAQPGRRPTRRALDRLVVEDQTICLLWGRVANELYGFVFAEPPVAVAARTWIWGVAILLVCVFAGAFAYEAVCLWRSAERAQREDELKTRFVSDVSHELKTPLAAMGLWLDLLRGGRLASAERQTHALAVVSEEKNRLLRLVESLLDFTRLESGRRRYELTSVDLGAAAREAATLLKGDFPEDGLRVDAPEGLVARADKDAVREILLNLLGNAAKYAAAGGPVEVRASRRDGQIVVAVADRGPGLSPEAQTKVFERFYRAEDAATRAKGGFGLGLPISRGLARGMGGELTVSARAGGGCTFTLALPVAPSSV